MLKKTLTMWIIFSSLCIIFTGCSELKNIINKEEPVISQSNPNKEKDTKIADKTSLEGIADNITELEVSFDPNGIHRSNEPIIIKDSKMILDVLTMIRNSKLITDETKIKNMSGMVTKDNSLFVISKEGTNKEVIFTLDDADFGVGYFEIDGQKYDPGYDFFRYMRDLGEYKNFDTNIDNSVIELFAKYNWTVDYRVNRLKLTLPSDFKYDVGEYPLKIYWAYNNKLSRNIGLDYKDFVGKQVEVDIYRLREPLPEYLQPRINSRGIVLSYDNKVIGAYIDAGRHLNFACSLDRKSLKDITGKEWDSWVNEHIDYSNELQIKLSKMNPEELIRQYYTALDKHDEKLQFACMTLQNVCNYMAMNMDNNMLINEGFKDAYVDGGQNIKSAKFISLKKVAGLNNPEGTIEYAAIVDIKFNKELTADSGTQTRFVILKKESDKIGWRIAGEGTGP